MTRYTLLALLVAVPAATLPSSRAYAAPPTYATDQYSGETEAELLRTLASAARKADKAIACKKLAFVGTAKSVSVLAELLRDPDLTSWSRIALEAIPDPTADAALIYAIEDLEGRPLIGVIQSVAARRTANAVGPLIGLLKSSDTAVATASAISLGTIGGDEATTALSATINSSRNAELRSAAAEGLVVCAERRMKQGDRARAIQLYDQVRASQVPQPRITEATRGAILARGIDGIDLLHEQLASDDRSRMHIAVTVARQIEDEHATAKLIELLGKVDAPRQSLLLTAIADRNDASAIPALLDATDSPHSNVQIAALTGLARIGDVGALTTLLEAAADDREEVAAAAIGALTLLRDDRVNSSLVENLSAADTATKRVLLDVIAARRIDAIEAVRAELGNANRDVRESAYRAVGEIITLEELSTLIAPAVDSGNPDAALALSALSAACVRMPDREATAELLGKSFEEAPLTAKLELLEVLTSMGGKKGLETVGQLAASGEAQLQDAATRLLGTWMTVDAAPVLMKLAKDPSHRYRIRALRGHLRITRQFLMRDRARLAMATEALEVATRDQEKRLVLDVIGRYPSVSMLRLAAKVAEDPDLKEEAKTVAARVVERLDNNPEAVAIYESIR